METADLDTTNITHISNLGLASETGDAQVYSQPNSSGLPNIWGEFVAKTKDFQCDICQKTYSSKAVLKKHKKIHGEFRCSKCSRGFKTKQELEKHVKLHSGYRPFSCMLCPNSFSEENSLKTHLRRFVGIS